MRIQMMLIIRLRFFSYNYNYLKLFKETAAEEAPTTFIDDNENVAGGGGAKLQMPVNQLKMVMLVKMVNPVLNKLHEQM